MDLVREFMEVDHLTPAGARALAATAAQPRPPGEWLALIAELDALIASYCAAAGLTGAASAAVLAARCGQSLASIPDTVEWFRREVARLDRCKPKRPPAPEQNCNAGAGAEPACPSPRHPIEKGSML